MSLKQKEILMRIKRIEAAIAELEFKIAQSEDDIERMQNHKQLQLEALEEAKKLLEE